MKRILMAVVLGITVFAPPASAHHRHHGRDWGEGRRTAEEKEHVRTLNRMFAKWQEHDIEGILSFFTDDVVYYNMPFPAPAVGKVQMRALLEQFVPLFGYVDLGAYNFICEGDMVATERVDVFEVIPTGKTGVFPIAGVFYFDRRGKITVWNDYFDARTFEKQTDLPMPQ